MGRACWQQGSSIADDWSSADGRQTLLRQRAEKLVARRPDVIYAGSQAGALAANDALHAEIAGGALVYARERLFERANRAQLPVIVASEGLAHAGALFSYGADSAGIVRRAAQLVDRILRGARPADMPVEQFSRIKFVVNAKASHLLGLSVPQAVLLRADEVIE